MLRTQSPSSVPVSSIHMEDLDQARHSRRKRKAEYQDNDRERLSKRLSLLNIEKNGSKLYVPVETQSANTVVSSDGNSATTYGGSMQMDDSKHKVYIYNIDDELSSDSESEEGKLVFLPDIEKHLRENRIPRHILANDDGELAGMQLVLYSDPRSLSVPEEKDGVRKAIIEARQRARDRQQQERQGINIQQSSPQSSGDMHIDGQVSPEPMSLVDEGYDAMEVD